MKATFKVKSSVPGVGKTRVILEQGNGDFVGGTPAGQIVIDVKEGTLSPNSIVTIEINEGTN